MSNYINEETIREYIAEYNGLNSAIAVLEYRQEQIEDILRNEHNFIINRDRLINVGGGE